MTITYNILYNIAYYNSVDYDVLFENICCISV